MHRNALVATLSVCATSIVVSGIVAHAGSLTPPVGVVVPTMKDLNTVEPRTPIDPSTFGGDADAVVLIDLPGSYYLTRSVVGQAGKHGIQITSDNVSIDLRGFRLQGVPASLDGINVEPVNSTGISVVNGVVAGWGDDGLDLINTIGSRIESVSVDGCAGTGIITGQMASIEGCTAFLCGSGMSIGADSVATSCASRSSVGNGFNTLSGAILEQCTSSSSGGVGILAGSGTVIRGCTVRESILEGIRASGSGELIIQDTSVRLGQRTGIDAGDGSRVSGCVAVGNRNHGIVAGLGSAIEACVARNNVNDGIMHQGQGVVRQCTATENTTGITGADYCLVKDNACIERTFLVTSGQTAIVITGDDSLIQENYAIGFLSENLMALNDIVLTATSFACDVVQNYGEAVDDGANDIAPVEGGADDTTGSWQNIR